MPTLVSSIPVHLHKLLEYRRLASHALDCEPCRVVEMTICHPDQLAHRDGFLTPTNFPSMLIIGIIRSKQHVTLGTREMLDVVFVTYDDVSLAQPVN
jgi:hypothetical protein